MQAKCREHGQEQNTDTTALDAQGKHAILEPLPPAKRQQSRRESPNAQVSDAHGYREHLFFDRVLQEKCDTEERNDDTNLDGHITRC